MGLFGLWGKKEMLQCTCGCGCRETFEKYGKRTMYSYAEQAILAYKKEWKGDYSICIDCNLDQHTKSTINKEDLSRKKFSSEVEHRTLENQDFRCNNPDCRKQIGVVKGRVVHYDFDHVDGNSYNNDPSNCQALCLNCHREKTERERSSKGKK